MRVAAAIAGLAGALLTLPSLEYGYSSWDDDRFVVENPVRAKPLGECLAWAVSEPHFESYHPLHLGFLCLELAAGGARPIVFHVASIALSALLGALVAWWLCGREGLAPAAAAAVAVAFLAHPYLVETRVSIASQKDLLGLIFGTGALIARDWRRAAVLVVFAALSKSGYGMYGLIWGAREVLLGEAAVRRMRTWIPAAAGLGVLGFGFYVAQSTGLPARGQAWFSPVLVGSTLAHYLLRLVVPLNLTPVQCLPGYAFSGAAVLALRRPRGLAAFGVAMAVLGLLPYLNVVPTPLLYSNRYAPLLVLGALVALNARPRPWLTAALALGLAAISVFLEQPHWRDARSLWRWTAAEAPCSPLARINLSVAELAAGDRQAAEAALFEAVALDPRDERIYRYLALAFMLGGDCGAPVSVERATQVFLAAKDDVSQARVAAANGWPATSAVLELRALAIGGPGDRAAVDRALERARACNARRAAQLWALRGNVGSPSDR